MALANFAAYKAMVTTPAQRVYRGNSVLGTQPVYLASFWTSSFPGPGVAPSTAEVPTEATAGALGQTDPSGQLWIPGVDIEIGNAASIAQLGNRTAIILCDRLSHQGGLDPATSGTVTTNLPTAALTRYTSGVGVMAAVEVYATVTPAAQTYTLTYTDQDGNAAQTSQPVAVSQSNRFHFWPANLAAGDYGVRSVEEFTLSGAAAASGNWGITLFKPLMILPISPSGMYSMDAVLSLGGNIPEVLANACLFFLILTDSSNLGTFQSVVSLGEA